MRCMLGFAGLISALGCSDTADTFRLRWPTIDGARSVIVGVSNEAGFEVHAASIDESHRLTIDAPMALEAAFFSETLEDIGLAPGRLPAVDGTHTRPLLRDPRAVIPDAPLTIYRLDNATDHYAWSPMNAVSDALAQYEMPTQPCPLWGPATLQVEVPMALESARVLDGRNIVLFSDSGDQRVLVTESGYETLSESEYHQLDLLRFEDGVAVGDEEGQVIYGQPSLTEVVVDGVVLGEPRVGRIRSLAGTSSSSIFAWSGRDNLIHFNGTTWKSLGKIEDPEGPLHLLGPDHVLFPTKQSDRIYTATPMGMFTENINLGDGVLSGARIDDLGIVLGTVDGAFFLQEGERWRLIDEEAGWWVLDIEPYAGGFAFLSGSGRSGFYRQDYGFCPELMNAPISSDARLLVTDIDLAIVVDVPEVNVTRVLRFPAPVD